MSTGVDSYSTTPSSNGTLGGTAYFPEGQAPSTVNDAARQVMADLASWFAQAKTPEYLTSVGGTATAITATGPAAFASYAAGQRFWFIPASTNTGATTLNVTPSGSSALGAKNIFSNGAACVGGEIVASVPVEVAYDGTQFNIMSAAPKFKALTATRDISTASGTQSLTGAGFKPKQVILIVSDATGSNARASWGCDDATIHYCIYSNASGSAGAFRINTSISININTSEGATAYTGVVSSMDSDGFTITWTKTGSPTGTYTIIALCLR